MYIANIFSKTTVNAPDDFNVVTSMDDIIDGLPTLIVGYDYVNKHFPDFDVTENYLGDNLYWTTRKNEKRDKYQEDLTWFCLKMYNDLTNRLSYVFVDPIQYRNKTLMKIIRKIYSLKEKVSYIDGDMIYIYGEKYIFGVDLKLLTYIGLDVEKIKIKIKQMSDVFLDDPEILIEYKKTISILDNKKRYLPFLYSIRNGQNSTSSLVYIPREG